MTEQTPTLYNPILPTPVPINDIDQIKLNVGTTGTGDPYLRSVSIPGRMKNNSKTFVKIFCI
jgi:hypothetical protein